MKTPLPLLFAFMLFGTALMAQTAKKDSINVVSIQDFEKKLQKKNVIVLDVRTPKEVAESSLEGVINIDYLGENFAQEIEVLNKKQTYLIYCKSGRKSREAASIMEKAGFKRVYMLNGGITAWEQAGKPIRNE
jgi:rhodanese-related sulfurtransferase